MSEPLVVVTSDDSSPSAVVVTQSPPPVVVVSPVTETRVIVTGIQGPPGVTILAALPVFDTDGTEHAIRFNSDLTLQFFDADGESTPIRLLSEPL